MANNPKPLWISHRGVRSSGASENSRLAFQKAVECGFSVLETDLRATADGHVVLHHDVFHKSHPQAPIHTLTRAEIGALDKDVMFLDEFLAEFSGFYWVFDVKVETGQLVINWLSSWCKGNDAVSWLAANTWFLFWDQAQERQLVAFLPNARCFARERDCWRVGLCHLIAGGRFAHVLPEKVYAIPPKLGPLSVLDKTMVSKIHQKGGKVLGYLPSSEDEVEGVLAAGVDYILCDFPSRALEKGASKL